MMEVINVSNLSKSYRLYKKPSDRLKAFLSRNISFETFNALDNVSFSVKSGETLGIIGENGAGKSTLLKILSGVLSPTAGQIGINGRVLSILELGVGFHPEFTGRENIFFYGDVLGFGRDFIRGRVDEIIGFSELGPFIDRTLKTYSTGMVMRLAFSVVTSFEPDIMVIDEALSVGDMHFQRKCIERIMEFKDNGKTILFSSHSTYQISMFCQRAIWLRDGMVAMDGSADKVIPVYEHYLLKKDQEIKETTAPAGALPVIIKELKLLNSLPLKRGDDVTFRIVVESTKPELPYHVTLSLKVDVDRGVYTTGTHMTGKAPMSGTENEIFITFHKIPLLGGTYYAHARVFDESGLLIYHEKILPPFNVVKDTHERGVCRLENHWDIRRLR